MEQPERLTTLCRWFVTAARQHLLAMEDMDEVAAGNETARLMRIYRAFRQEGSMGQEALLGLVDHGEPAVAGMAAVFSLRYAPERCKVVLLAISRQEGLLAMRAEVALERWEKGEWDLD
ncbi:MAG TPA: hypothetical protein VFR01_01010 [Geobacterales bacterium]|nr:hypothetical protein [Geobacterales bacterium]